VLNGALLSELSRFELPANLGVQAGTVVAWLSLLLLLSEGINRYTTWGGEVARKVVHIGTGNVILIAWWLAVPSWLGVLASVVFSILTLISYRLPILPSVSGVGRQSWGTFFYAVSIGVLIARFWTPELTKYAVIGVLIMTWGDGLAALVGQSLGKHRYTVWGIQKSWEGSLAMMAVSLLVCGGVLLLAPGSAGSAPLSLWGIAGLVALVATGLEAFSKYGIDNLTVPLGSAWLCFALEKFC
jgi:phytol kinase